MLLSIPSQPTLKDLKTREDSDLSIGLMDSWALVADVLTFYQERIANEGFLRTATERRSLLELARSVGYELKPGVAASAYLTFSMDTAASSPKKATIGIGTKVQSVPAQGESAQVFETMEEIEARKAWNEIKPQQREERQDLQAALAKGEVVLAGTSTKLTVGDGLLFTIGGTMAAFVIANQVVIEAAAAGSRTRVIFAPAQSVDTQAIERAGEGRGGEEEEEDTDSILDSEGLLSQSDIREIIGSPWTESDLQSKATIEGWSMDKIVEAINSERKKEKVTGDAVYAFRVKCLALDGRSGEGDVAGGDERPEILLDNIYPNVQAENWIVLKSSTRTSAFYVAETAESTETSGTIMARVTSLILEKKKWVHLDEKDSDPYEIPTTEYDVSSFKRHDTSIYAAPEQLGLADSTVETPVEGNEILLDSMVGGLRQERPIAVSGELEDQPGIIRKEIAILSNIVHFEDDNNKLLTKLYLSEPLAYRYKRSTVNINANVARSTHGETKEAALGSGDPTQKFQEFILKDSPLTYVSGATASGAKSTLQVSVDRIKWEEKESFEGMGYSERAYITRRSDDGKTTVIFGDGVTGRLPSSGQENVKAKYRIGIGSDGLLEADQLSILMTRPLGVRGVTNPLKTSGAEDPESLDDARRNAPRTVLTMDRIVSLEDYKNFAQGFAGVGKATSYTVRIGGNNVVLLAVSAEGGEELDIDHRKTLTEAIELYKDPAARFTVRSFQPRAFNVEAKLMVSSDREFDDVKAAVKDTLKEAFSFESRNFGQAVTISEVISVIQGVEGVEAVDIEYLYEHRAEEDGGGPKVKRKEDVIRAAAKEDADGVMIPSLLLINEDGITLEEEKKMVMMQQP